MTSGITLTGRGLIGIEHHYQTSKQHLQSSDASEDVPVEVVDQSERVYGDFPAAQVTQRDHTGRRIPQPSTQGYRFERGLGHLLRNYLIEIPPKETNPVTIRSGSAFTSVSAGRPSNRSSSQPARALAREAGHFDFDDVAAGLADKLVRRHAGALATALAEEPLRSFSRPPALEALDAEGRQHLKALQAGVAQAAERLGIEPALLASKRDLVRHMHGDGSVLEGGWRAPHLADVLAEKATA